MSVRYRKLEDLSTFRDGMGRLRTEWPDARQSLYLAIRNTAMNDIERRTPESTKQRYPNDPERGNANLYKSIKLHVSSNSGSMIKVYVGSEGVSYARRVHDMEDPKRNGKPVRWTKQGSGNKFLYLPLKKNETKIPVEMMDEIDARIERMGL